jgi:hypothetical protein
MEFYVSTLPFLYDLEPRHFIPLNYSVLTYNWDSEDKLMDFYEN